MSKLVGLVALLCLVASPGFAQQVEISVLPTGTTARAELDWQAIPGQTYTVHTTTNLLTVPWTNAAPAGIVASNVLGHFEAAATNRLQFFRVAKEDTDPPTVVALVPASDAIAVASNAQVVITLADETGIDTNSLRLTIAGWPDMTLGGGMLSYSNPSVYFTPPAALGTPGAVVGNTLTVSDVLGHTLSDYTWTFQLARLPVTTNAFLPLTAPDGQARQVLANGKVFMRSLPSVQPLNGPAGLHIVSVTSNAVVFSYTGDPPEIGSGTKLVSFDALHRFYLQVVSNDINVAQSQITAWTTDLVLTDLLEEGSFSSADFAPAEIIQGPAARAAASANLLHVEFGDDLSGTILYTNQNLKIHLPSAYWNFVGDIDVAADFFFWELRSFDAEASGVLTISVSPEALFYAAVEGTNEFPLVHPVTKVFGTVVGVVPVWVEVIMELNAGYKYAADTSGFATTRVFAEKEMTFYVRLRQNQWTPGIDNPPLVLEADPITWQIEGSAEAKVYVRPKLTVLAYSVAGLWADIVPYSRFAGQYQLNPLEYDLNLYFGLTSTLGLESRIWYGGWGEKPTWPLYNNEWPLWSYAYPESGGAPRFLSQLSDRTVQEGARVVLAAYAEGSPTPEYQWYFNDRKIIGAQSPECLFGPATVGSSGRYAVRASNSKGGAETACTVTVEPRLPPTPRGMVLVPAGSFQMGNSMNPAEGGVQERPVHQVFVSGFYMDRYEMSNREVAEVMQWAHDNKPPLVSVDNSGVHNAVGDQKLLLDLDDPFCQISFSNGVFFVAAGRDSYPCHLLSWYGACACCNYRSERDAKKICYAFDDWTCDWSANGYRLPTEAEWEKAARGGRSGMRFPWGNTVSHGQANYYSMSTYLYDVGPTGGYHPDFVAAGRPYTCPVDSFAPNAYGLCNMVGNVPEWCWDWYQTSFYASSPANDPRGPSTGSGRVHRGGSSGDINNGPFHCRVSDRTSTAPAGSRMGFRAVQHAVQ